MDSFKDIFVVLCSSTATIAISYLISPFIANGLNIISTSIIGQSINVYETSSFIFTSCLIVRSYISATSVFYILLDNFINTVVFTPLLFEGINLSIMDTTSNIIQMINIGFNQVIENQFFR